MPVAHINGHRMYYETQGHGPPVLCMTGWGTICHGRSMFLPHSLTKANYQLIYFDHRGIGESENAPEIEHSTDLYADDAASLLEHLKLNSAHVVGLGGMGALIGQKMAINHHDHVLSLAMFGPWAKVDHYLGDQLRLFDMLHEKIGFEAYQMCAALFCYTPEHYHENHSRIISPNGPWQMIKNNQPIHNKFITACLKHDTTGELNKIDQPTLIIMGGKEDLMTGDRVGQVILKGIPHAEYVVIEGAPHAHQAYPEADKILNDTIGDFVRRQVENHA